MRILVVGQRGQLGCELSAERLAGPRSAPGSIEVLGRSRTELDITDANAVKASVEAIAPAVVINAAAYTQVDRAEEQEALAAAVNAEGPSHLATACKAVGATLIHVSTDYVFDGRQSRPYREGDPVAPLGVYGRTKAAGEQAIREQLAAHVIIRTAWLFGAHGKSFVHTMLRLGGEREELSIVNDQHGSPTPAVALAEAIGAVLEALKQGRTPFGTYHYAGAEPTTWFGFAQAIFEAATPQGKPKPRLNPIGTAQYPTPAPRPAYSVLDSGHFTQTFGVPAADWRSGLTTMLAQISTTPQAPT